MSIMWLVYVKVEIGGLFKQYFTNVGIESCGMSHIRDQNQWWHIVELATLVKINVDMSATKQVNTEHHFLQTASNFRYSLYWRASRLNT